MNKEILKSGYCGNVYVSYEIYQENGKYAVRFFGNDWIELNYGAPWREFPIQTVIIEEGIEGISSQAFCNCNQLKDVYLPQSLNNIGKDVFEGCDAIQSIHITDVGAYAKIQIDGNSPLAKQFNLFVNGKPVRNLEINQVCDERLWTTLYPVFSGCTTLERVTVNVDCRMLRAFANCPNLVSVVLPSKSKYVYAEVFSNCISLKEVEFPFDLEQICNGAFYNCQNLQEINIPDGVKIIEDYAFANCLNAKSIALPASLEKLSKTAFENCQSLQSITAEGGKNFYAVDNCLCNRRGWLLHGCVNSVIPSNVIRIDDKAFYGCKELYNITLPDSVIAIGQQAFENCVNLTTVHLSGDNLPEISKNCFTNCPNLQGFSKKDGSILTVNNLMWAQTLARFDKACPQGRCPESTRRVCALLRGDSVERINFSLCNTHSLELKQKDGARFLTFTITTNAGPVYPDSSMPYYEYDVDVYSCLIPEEVADSDAVDYACKHKSQWTHSQWTEKDSI